MKKQTPIFALEEQSTQTTSIVCHNFSVHVSFLQWQLRYEWSREWPIWKYICQT